MFFQIKWVDSVDYVAVITIQQTNIIIIRAGFKSLNSIVNKHNHINICYLGFNSCHKVVVFLMLLSKAACLVQKNDWRAQLWRSDVISVMCGDLVASSAPLSSPERHKLSGRLPKGRRSFPIFSASNSLTFIRPVWWILFSALLSWVIWGIIPKVSTPNCAPCAFQPEDLESDAAKKQPQH